MGERGKKPKKAGTGSGGWFEWASTRRVEIEKALGRQLSNEAWARIDEAMVRFTMAMRPNNAPVDTRKNVSNSYENVRKRADKRLSDAFKLLSAQSKEEAANDAISENWTLSKTGGARKGEVEKRLRKIRMELLELMGIVRDAEIVPFNEPSYAEAKSRAVKSIAVAVSGELDVKPRKKIRSALAPFEILIWELQIHSPDSGEPDDAWAAWLRRAINSPK